MLLRPVISPHTHAVKVESEWLAAARKAAIALHLCPWRPELAAGLAAAAVAASARLAPAAARVGAVAQSKRPAVHGAVRSLIWACVRFCC